MNPMSTAGSPARASTRGPLPRSAFGGAAPEAQALAPPDASGDADPLAAFFADATARRNQHTRQETGRPEDWADPDPAPLAYRHAGSHPVDRAAHRHRLGDSRNDFLRRVRVACESLQDLEPRSLARSRSAPSRGTTSTRTPPASTARASTAGSATRPPATTRSRCCAESCCRATVPG